MAFNLCSATVTDPNGGFYRDMASYLENHGYKVRAIKRRESIIVTDPDGGLYRDMAPYLESHGYKVRTINQ